MSVKATFAAALAAALIAFGPQGAVAVTAFSSTLTGDQEVPPTGSPFTGTAAYTLRVGGTLGPSLAFDFVFDPVFDFGIGSAVASKTVTGLHIHQAPRGVNGPIVFGLIGVDNDTDDDAVFMLLADGSTRITGEWDATEGENTTLADLVSLFADTPPGADTPFYLNLHTIDFPAGEIRGQITAIPLPATLPLMAGALLLLAVRRRPRTV